MLKENENRAVVRRYKRTLDAVAEIELLERDLQQRFKRAKTELNI